MICMTGMMWLPRIPWFLAQIPNMQLAVSWTITETLLIWKWVPVWEPSLLARSARIIRVSKILLPRAHSCCILAWFCSHSFFVWSLSFVWVWALRCILALGRICLLHFYRPGWCRPYRCCTAPNWHWLLLPDPSSSPTSTGPSGSWGSWPHQSSSWWRHDHPIV